MSTPFNDAEHVSRNSLVRHGQNVLKSRSSTPRLDAELLLRFVEGISKTQLIAYGDELVELPQRQQFETLLHRRMQGEPIAYLLGAQEFYGREFLVSPAVLIPRPETEALVDEVLRLAKQRKTSPLRVLDMGTGSGCIAVSIVAELRALHIPIHLTATEISQESLHVAQQNAKHHEVESAITFLESDWWQGLNASVHSFDCIVSNPPYIAEGDPRCSIETTFEPAHALYAGSDGCDDFRTILKKLPEFLQPGGSFFGECGAGQGTALQTLAHELLPAGFGRVEILADLAGLDRILMIHRAL